MQLTGKKIYLCFVEGANAIGSTKLFNNQRSPDSLFPS